MADKITLADLHVYSTIQLETLETLEIDNGVFYTQGHIVEVSPQEAVELLNTYPDNFKVVQNDR